MNKLKLVAFVAVSALVGCNTTPTSDGTVNVDGREFDTEDSNKDPIVVYYKAIVKKELPMYLACEKELSKTRVDNGIRPIRVTTDVAESLTAHMSNWQNYMRASDPDVELAKYEMRSCVHNKYRAEASKR